MEILCQDKEFAVIVKPVGMESQAQVPQELTGQLGGVFYPVHRLDLNVGGVMVYARSKPAAAALSKAIQDGAMVKEYVAVVHGEPPESGDWEDLLFKDSSKNKVFVVKKQRAGVKSARLEYSLLQSGESSLVAIRLHTGRTHQIRCQFSSRELPLVGDRKYSLNEDGCDIALWSYRLAFSHPRTGEKMEFSHLPPEKYPWNEV